MKLTKSETQVLNRMLSETLIYMYSTDSNMQGVFFKGGGRDIRVESFHKLRDRKLIEKFKLEKYGKSLRHAWYTLSGKGIKAIEKDEDAYFSKLNNKTR